MVYVSETPQCSWVAEGDRDGERHGDGDPLASRSLSNTYISAILENIDAKIAHIAETTR